MSEWEPLSTHLAEVGEMAARFATDFHRAGMAKAAGQLHDIGKCSAEFLAYISAERKGGPRGPDHSTAGAREAVRLYGDQIGRMLAFAIAGHHAGLPDFEDLKRRLDPALYEIKAHEGWEAEAGDLPSKEVIWPSRGGTLSPHAGFTQAFLTRMVFSCLVDADFLATERFYARVEGREPERGFDIAMTSLRDRLRTFMAEKRGSAAPSPLNMLRNEVLDNAIGQADLPPGLFTLTVPTGGGKTLASLSFALEHAVRHGLRRVIYVIPFTSIIEQTASAFRGALGEDIAILEHHASFDWETLERKSTTFPNDDEGPAGVGKLRRAAENWDAPIVVTTAVQFFESLFAARTSRCRKLHNLAKSVIVLDEAQTMPLRLLRPCMAAIDELARNYDASIVLCTATQPALRKIDGFKQGLAVGDDRELAPDPKALYAQLKRVDVHVLKEPVTDEMIAGRVAEQSQMLCIVNNRAHAKALFEKIASLPGAAHLTTLMCPRHRRRDLADLRAKLSAGEPVRLIATSLIEAGVDIDFPEVWRAVTGLDSIAQAAGRCNREGRANKGRVVVFQPADARIPRDIETFWQATRQILPKHGGDLLSLEAVQAYFGELYWQKGAHDVASRGGTDPLDETMIGDRPGILAAIRERAREMSFPFTSIATGFQMIETAMAPVIVPWDDEARQALSRIGTMERPLARDLRILQQYTVSIPPQIRSMWLGSGVLRAAHKRLGDELLCFDDLAHYREATGLDISDPKYRVAEDNVF